MAPTSYGSLGPLGDDQLQAALDRFGLGRLERAWPLTEGLFGKNIAIDTTDGTWVLRGDPWPSDVQLRREAFFAGMIHHGCAVPAPWPYYVERQPGVFPWPYAVMRRMDGLDLSDPSVDWVDVAGALGRGLAELHRITWPRPGEWHAGPNAMVGCEGGSGEWLEARVAAWLFQMAVSSSEPLDPAGEELVLAALARAQAELGSGVETTYVHHDYKPTNVSFTRGSDGALELAGVFDLGEGYAGDPLEDLPRALCSFALGWSPAVGAAYLSSYREASGRELSVERIVAYAVFDLLVMWEFGRRPAQAWFPSESTFSPWAETWLRAVRDALDLV